MRRSRLVVAAALFPFTLFAGVDQLTNREAIRGLREALTQGTNQAIVKLGVKDGFFKNERVKIPLPEGLAKARKLFDMLGQGQSFDELELAINRAAEAAVPEAKALLIDAVQTLSLQDAKQIITGGDTAATDYLKKTTKKPLGMKFLPIVQQATAKVGLAQQYNVVAAKAAEFGLLGKDQAKLEEYVTGKALDGLFTMIAVEEKKIRRDPWGQASRILKRVFGAVGG